MNENGKQKIVLIDPSVAEEFRKITKRIDGLVDKNRRLAIKIQDERRAREALERQEVDIDGLPGKRLPFRHQINIPLPGGTDTPVKGSVNVSRDGPFICRRLYASVLITGVPETIPGAVDYSRLIGRYTTITSSEEYNFWNYWTLPVFEPLIVYPPLDFEWTYNDTGSERNRQDKPISGDILNRRDDDGFLMNNEIFAAGTKVDFTVSPTRATPLLTLLGAEIGPIDLEFQVTFDGFKVLQPLGM